MHTTDWRKPDPDTLAVKPGGYTLEGNPRLNCRAAHDYTSDEILR